MKGQWSRSGPLLFAGIASIAVGCSDGGNPTSTGTQSSSSGNGGGGGSGGSETLVASPGTEIVSGGTVVKSDKFKMVITFGGSTPAGGTMDSPKHRLQGGLVGVTEGSK